jgi:tetratricopeptide (TPR) repeat protein
MRPSAARPSSQKVLAVCRRLSAAGHTLRLLFQITRCRSLNLQVATRATWISNSFGHATTSLSQMRSTIGGLRNGWGFRESFVFSVFLLVCLLAVNCGRPVDQKSSQDASATAADQGTTSKLPPVSAEPNVLEQPESKVLGSSSGSASSSGAQEHGDIKFADTVADLRALVAEREALNKEGVLLAKKGDLDGAITAFRKAIEIDPKIADTHANLAAALKKQGREEEAQRELAEAERLRRN